MHQSLTFLIAKESTTMKETQLFFFKMAAGCLKILGRGLENTANLIEMLTGVKKSPAPEKAKPEKEDDVQVEKSPPEVDKSPETAPPTSESPEASEEEQPAVTVEEAKKPVEEMEKPVEKAEKPKAAPKSKPKAKKSAKKASTITAIDRVKEIIYSSDGTVTSTQLKEQTGFTDKKIQNIVYKLKQRGQITSPDKGIYQKPR
jgi:hypothetical protein